MRSHFGVNIILPVGGILLCFPRKLGLIKIPTENAFAVFESLELVPFQ